MSRLMYLAYGSQTEISPVITVDNPSSDLVKSKLDEVGKTLEFVRVFLNSGALTVAYADKGRALVYFQGERKKEEAEGDWQWGKLFDPNISDRKSLIDYTLNGIESEDYFYRTVELDVACNVAIHFFEHGAFPANLTWEGNMSKFPNQSSKDWTILK